MSRSQRYRRNLGRRLPEPTPVRTTTVWVRFEHEDEPYGLFSYGSTARARLAKAEVAELDAHYAWFVRMLHAPDLGDRSTARFWFVRDDGETLTRARALAELLRRADIPIVERTTTRVPGKIVWAAEDQVAVLTYRDTPRPRKARRRA